MTRREALRTTGWLTGGSLAAPALLTLLQSCDPEVDGSDWTPEFFTAEEAASMTALVDTLLPRTETPGGLDVGVDRFLDRFYAQCLDAEEQAEVRKQLAVFNAAGGEAFDRLDATRREKVLRDAEAVPGKFNPGVWGSPVGEEVPVSWYRGLKSTMIWAYLSSEKIGTEVLAYDPIPGEYRGCIPLSEVGARWAL